MTIVCTGKDLFVSANFASNSPQQSTVLYNCSERRAHRQHRLRALSIAFSDFRADFLTFEIPFFPHKMNPRLTILKMDPS
jgi:hypothetical protein